MSGFGAGVGKAVGGLGGPQVAAIAIAGGLVVGAIGGGLIAGGGSGQGATSAATLAIYPCPEAGPALATVPSGQQFLVTGKNADATWVRIYYPLPGRTEAWVTSGPLQFDGSLGALPVVPCSPVEAGPGASVEPGASLTAIQDNSPSPPPSAPPTTGPTTSPDGGPNLARLVVGSASIAGGPERYCKDTARSVSITVRATDRTGIDGVVLSWRPPGAAAFSTRRMTPAGGDTWRATIATDTDGITRPGSLRFFISASDEDPRPHTSRLPTEGSRSIAVAKCANAGPVLASMKASPGTVFTNSDACRTRPRSTTVSVTARDVDGVGALTLHYRLPGDGSFRDKPMAKAGASWRAAVTPVDQRPNADGKVSYFVTGKDDLGESTRSATRTFTVDRCDFEAAIRFSDSTGTPFCPQHPTRFFYLANDRDGLTASSATFVYTYRLANGRTKTAKAEMSGSDQGQGTWTYTVELVPTAAWALDGSTVTFFMQTKDRFGGTSRGGDGKASQGC